MPVQGTLKLKELRLMQFNMDQTGQSLELKATAALVEPTTGTAAWFKCSGNTWSPETMERLKALVEAMENDMASTVMDDVESTPNQTTQRAQRPQMPAGLGEHLAGDEPTQM